MARIRLSLLASLLAFAGCTPLEREGDAQAYAPGEAKEPLEGVLEQRDAPMGERAREEPKHLAVEPPGREAAPPADRLTSEDFWRRPSPTSTAQLEQQIALLRRLLAVSSPDSPDYPDIALRLATTLHDLRIAAPSPATSQATLEVLDALISTPAYAKFKRIDQALFLYAGELRFLQRLDEMRRVYLVLVKTYPQSATIPFVFAAFGDDYFARGKHAEAARFYEKVAQLQEDGLFAYAQLQLGYCFMDMQGDGAIGPRYDKALHAFYNAINAASAGRGGSPELAARLRRQARLDLTLAYRHAGRPSKAHAFFRKVGVGPGDEDETVAMMEALAGHHADAGEHVEAMLLLKTLLAEHPGEPRACVWAARIVKEARAVGEPQAIARELAALQTLAASEPWRRDEQCVALGRERSAG